MSDKRPKLGEWCTTTNSADKYRSELAATVASGNSYHRVEWKHKCLGWKPAPVKAMYIGYRLKREGIYWERGGYEDWERCFKCSKTVEVWMFIVNARSKPFAVFPEDVELSTENTESEAQHNDLP